MLRGGYCGRILRVDLTAGTTVSVPLDQEVAQRFLGGRGYGARVLYDENPTGVDPFAPQNRLAFFAGPFVGTSLPCSVKTAAVTRSPLTQTILMTFSGGHFGPELKLAGWDGIVVTGRSERPVCLHVDHEQARLRDAAWLWGKDTADTAEALRRDLGDRRVRVAAIGPAGEKLCRFACITNERRTFGRGGAGAVMGSKNLKAIALRGSRPVPLSDRTAFDALVKEIRERFRQSEGVKFFSKYGTTFGVDNHNELGMLPTRNFRAGVFSEADKIGKEACLGLRRKRTACRGCPVGCGAIRRATDERYAGAWTEGPEYETLFALGSQCGNSNLSAIIAADDLCDRLGLDTISTGNAIAWAMECYEKGVMDRTETDGLELRFGNHEVIVEMVKRIGLRQGLGDTLAEGSFRASQVIGSGSGHWAMQVKGSELAGFDARGAMAMGLGFATSPRGGDHERAYVFDEVGSVPPLVDRFATAGKATLLKFVQDEQTVVDALGICCFLAKGDPMGLPDYARLFTYATGEDITEELLMVAGERIWTLERLYNCREGFGRKDDVLPTRFTEEVLAEGASSGHRFPMELMLDDYYRVRAWDTEGRPTPALLARMGLE